MNKKLVWLTQDELLNDVNWWTIYFRSFPIKELDSIKQLINALAKGLAKFASYKMNNTTVAIVILYEIQSVPFTFLNYFAVAKKYRNQAIGSELFSSLAKYIETKKSDSFGLIWEVEDPNQTLTKKIKLAEKRINFYQKHGAKLLPGIFTQPPLDGSHLVDMRLMYISKKNEKEMASQANAIKKALYFEKYHRINQISKNVLLNLLKDNDCSRVY